jgi:trans-aconitate methyltransferase
MVKECFYPTVGCRAHSIGVGMEFTNSYEDKIRAESYATLEFAGTYHLAFRDLPDIVSKYVTGTRALDFGCGTGRSSRLLHSLGFQTTGTDISEEMITLAKQRDPQGEYHRIADGDFNQFTPRSFNLILSAFTFDNIPTMEKKVQLFSGLASLLAAQGTFINLVCSPDIYIHEWVSFSTKQFPENKKAQSGDVVRIITNDFADKRPCYDILWSDADYNKVYAQAGLKVVAHFKPRAKGDEPYPWVNETRIAPWVIYVLKKK